MRHLISLIAASALLAGCTCAADQAGSTSSVVSAEDARSLLIDRNWLDRWPTGKDDRLHVYRFVPTMGGGVYQDRTLFLGFFELFTFEVGKAEIRFHFPDMDERVRSTYRIERVSGPEPFDLRLTVESTPRGPGVYYSVERWHGTTWHELDRQLKSLEPSR